MNSNLRHTRIVGTCYHCEEYVSVSQHDYVETLNTAADFLLPLDTLERFDRILDIPRNETVCALCTGQAYALAGVMPSDVYLGPTRRDLYRLHRLGHYLYGD